MMNQHMTILGVPMDLGQDRRGVDMGPSAVRYAQLRERLEALGLDIRDEGNLDVPAREQCVTEGYLKCLKEVTRVNRLLAQKVSAIVAQGRFPLILGGDHSIAIGTIAGVRQHYKNLGVIWYDAHGDLNTHETSPSGNIHGMPLAISLGLGDEELIHIESSAPKIKAENVVIIGARMLDDGERKLIHKRGIKVYTMHEIDRLGMARVMEEAIDYVSKRTDGVHLSLDLDALDPHDAPGVGTPVNGGMTYRESHLAMEILAESKILTSAEVVEVNPILDHANKTGNTAVALISSLFGEKLL